MDSESQALVAPLFQGARPMARITTASKRRRTPEEVAEMLEATGRHTLSREVQKLGSLGKIHAEAASTSMDLPGTLSEVGTLFELSGDQATANKVARLASMLEARDVITAAKKKRKKKSKKRRSVPRGDLLKAVGKELGKEYVDTFAPFVEWANGTGNLDEVVGGTLRSVYRDLMDKIREQHGAVGLGIAEEYLPVFMEGLLTKAFDNLDVSGVVDIAATESEEEPDPEGFDGSSEEAPSEDGTPKEPLEEGETPELVSGREDIRKRILSSVSNPATVYRLAADIAEAAVAIAGTANVSEDDARRIIEVLEEATRVATQPHDACLTPAPQAPTAIDPLLDDEGEDDSEDELEDDDLEIAASVSYPTPGAERFDRLRRMRLSFLEALPKEGRVAHIDDLREADTDDLDELDGDLQGILAHVDEASELLDEDCPECSDPSSDIFAALAAEDTDSLDEDLDALDAVMARIAEPSVFDDDSEEDDDGVEDEDDDCPECEDGAHHQRVQHRA